MFHERELATQRLDVTRECGQKRVAGLLEAAHLRLRDAELGRELDLRDVAG